MLGLSRIKAEYQPRGAFGQSEAAGAGSCQLPHFTNGSPRSKRRRASRKRTHESSAGIERGAAWN